MIHSPWGLNSSSLQGQHQADGGETKWIFLKNPRNLLWKTIPCLAAYFLSPSFPPSPYPFLFPFFLLPVFFFFFFPAYALSHHIQLKLTRQVLVGSMVALMRSKFTLGWTAAWWPEDGTIQGMEQMNNPLWIKGAWFLTNKEYKYGRGALKNAMVLDWNWSCQWETWFKLCVHLCFLSSAHWEGLGVATLL